MDKRIESLLLTVQKPSKYVGGEFGSIVKDIVKDNIDTRFAFCFPDTYEIGMSHLGMKILYGLINSMDNVWCERVFTPDIDMEEKLRSLDIPLFALESGESIGDFDFVGFTIQYELCYTNILNMLELAKIPLLSSERKDHHPFVIGGGPCTCNAEPIADFFDIITIGEGEEITVEIINLYRQHKANGGTRQQFLEKCAKIDGVYIPSFYDVAYNNDGTVSTVTPNNVNAPTKPKRRIVTDLDKAYYPENIVVPFGEIIHDRAMVEMFRGCIRGCRFCQAGMIYRPVREKTYSTIEKQARALCENTGYEEFSLTSLSSSDYSDIEPLLDNLLDWTFDKKISISLPSMRIDNFSKELMQKIQKTRKSGLTFAPEAGSQRLRDAINKNISYDEIINTCKIAFEGGNTSVKLYFMCGLPTETMGDVLEIATLAQAVVDTFCATPTRSKGKAVQVTVSVSNFVPKPFTPFQWEAQNTAEEFSEKHRALRNAINSKKIKFSYHDSETSFLEAVFSRGDRRLSKVIMTAFLSGCKFDTWEEHFKYYEWLEAFDQVGLDPHFYANRERGLDEVLPWSHIDMGITDKFLKRQRELAYKGVTTPDCRGICSNCGANVLVGGVCSVRQ